jgi:hypothetical protein
METVAYFATMDQALIARSVLGGHGIEALIPDENVFSVGGFYSQNAAGIRLQVFPQDIKEAREILDQPPLDYVGEKEIDK